MEARPQATRTLVEGAFLTAITILFAVMDVYVPLFILVYPIPIVILVIRRGLRPALLATVTAVVGTSALVGFAQGITVLFRVGIVGLALGWGLRRRLSPLATVAITALAVGISVALTFGVSVWFFKIDVHDLIPSFESTINRVIDIYRTIGIKEEELKILEKNARQMFSVAMQALPAIIGLALFVVGAVNYFVTRTILVKIGYPVEAMPGFSRWRIPWYWGWGYLLGSIGIVIGGWQGLPVISRIGVNLFAVFSYAFLVQGLSVGWFFADKYKVSPFLRYLFAAFLLLNQFLMQLVVWVGLFDAWFDFRKLGTTTPA